MFGTFVPHLVFYVKFILYFFWNVFKTEMKDVDLIDLLKLKIDIIYE